MTPQSLRDFALYNRGLKEGAMHVQSLAQFQGLSEFQKKSQEFIDAAEDIERNFAVEIQKTSNPPEGFL